MARAAPDIVVAGHICLDVIPTFPGEVPDPLCVPGTLVEVGGPLMSTGGAVSNVGLALHRLGMSTRLIGKVGDDLFGRAIGDILGEHDRMLAESLIVDPEDASSYTIVVNPPGVDRSFFHAPGANSTFRPSEVDPGRVEGARVFHFGYPPLMERTFVDGGEALASLFAEIRRRGVAVSLDMAQYDPASKAGQADWLAFLRRVLPEVDVFGPSLGETLAMLGETMRQPATGGGLIDLADRLLRMGPALVVFKLGADGLFLRSTGDASRVGQVPALQLGDRWCRRTLLHGGFEVDVVGTTGAGDCALAALLAAMVKERSPEEALRDASAVGACSVERTDATSGVPAWPVVQRRLQEGWPQRPVDLELDGWTWREDERLWSGPPRTPT
ncbi:MAG: carbohydrate kinase family protein [Rhodothermales bacterium]